jgi:predicted phosphodiesterase
MKKILIFFIVLLTQNSNAYEWYQVNDRGINFRKIEIDKNNEEKEILLKDLKFESKLMDEKEILKKFPNYFRPKKIVLIGDTGCRIVDKKGRSEFQNCNDPKEWPFKLIADQVISERPDLVIHLGDYHYRESCLPGSKCEAYSKYIGYEWKPWELDFFVPMNELLKVSPIIIVRGNHEDCNRAYAGYKKLLSNEDWGNECRDYEEPKIVVINDIALINFDSSSIDDQPKLGVDEAKWVKRLDELSEKLSKLKYKKVWLLTHKPIYGVAQFMKAFVPTNINFRSYLEKSKLKNKINLIFSGHVHTSLLEKSKNLPSQIVLGNSGTRLDSFEGQLNSNLLKFFNYDSAEFVNNGFGYAVLNEISPNHWNIQFKDLNSKTLKEFPL